MNLYIDLENVISFLSSDNKNGIDECTSLIKKGLDLYFNFKKEIIDLNSKEGQLISAWLNKMTDGLKTNKAKWERFIDSSQLKANFPATLPPTGKRSVYLLNNSKVISLIKEKGAILIGSVGEEIKLLKSLIIENTEELAKNINSWKEYCPKLPLTDLIICDNHFFKDKYVYEANKNELLEGIIQLPNQSPVNCVIIVKEGNIDRDFKLNEKAEELRNELKNITNSTKSNVTIIKTLRTHDRCAITNYYRIKCGSSFHLKNSGLKNDVLVETKTHANSVNEKTTNHLISEFQDIVNTIRDKDIYGNKVSNFLTFTNLSKN